MPVRSTNRLVLMAAMIFGLAGCGTMDNIFKGEDNLDPPAELEKLKNVIEVRELWSADVGKGRDEQQVKLVPVSDRGVVFAADRRGEVSAYDAESGDRLWEVDTETLISGGPGAGEGLVLLGTSDAKLVALDQASGEERWRAPVSSEVLSVPVAAGGVVVVRSIDGGVFGLQADNGERIWAYAHRVPALTLHGTGSPTIHDQLVICGFASGKLVALNLADGNVAWEATLAAPSGRSELERMVDIDGDPLVIDGVAFVTTYQADLTAVDINTGVVLWRRELSSHAGLGGDWRELYVTDVDDHVWSVNPRNGSALWRQEKFHARKLTSPAVIGEFVVVGDFEGYLHWLARDDGRVLARVRVDSDGIGAAPLVVGDTAYVYGNGGELVALRVAIPEAE